MHVRVARPPPTHTDTDTQTQTHTDTDTQTDTHRHTHTQIQRHRHTHTLTHSHTEQLESMAARFATEQTSSPEAFWILNLCSMAIMSRSSGPYAHFSARTSASESRRETFLGAGVSEKRPILNNKNNKNNNTTSSAAAQHRKHVGSSPKDTTLTTRLFLPLPSVAPQLPLRCLPFPSTPSPLPCVQIKRTT